MTNSETKIKLRAVVAVGALIAGLGVIAHIKNNDPARIAELKVEAIARAETNRVEQIEREQRDAARAEAKRVADIKYAADQAERAAKRAADEAERAAKRATEEAAEKAEAERKAKEPIKLDEATAEYVLGRYSIKGCTINGSKNESGTFVFQCTDGRVFALQQREGRIYLARYNAVSGNVEYVKK